MPASAKPRRRSVVTRAARREPGRAGSHQVRGVVADRWPVLDRLRGTSSTTARASAGALAGALKARAPETLLLRHLAPLACGVKRWRAASEMEEQRQARGCSAMPASRVPVRRRSPSGAAMSMRCTRTGRRAERQANLRPLIGERGPADRATTRRRRRRAPLVSRPLLGPRAAGSDAALDAGPTSYDVAPVRDQPAGA